jgi:hypothetical protein
MGERFVVPGQPALPASVISGKRISQRERAALLTFRIHGMSEVHLSSSLS